MTFALPATAIAFVLLAIAFGFGGSLESHWHVEQSLAPLWRDLKFLKQGDIDFQFKLQGKCTSWWRPQLPGEAGSQFQ